MKKILVMGLACAMIMAPIVSVHAAEVPETCHIGGCNLGECFMDTDCDGICGDHVFVDENGDGICDNHCYLDANADGICDHFIDADEDGVCDHCHDHGKPVSVNSSTVNQNTTNNTNTTSGNTVTYSSHHGGCHSRRSSGHHRGHC